MPLYNRLNRRHLLRLSLGALTSILSIVLSIVLAGKSTFSSRQRRIFDDPNRDFSVTERSALKERAMAKGLIYGAAVRYDQLFSDHEFAARLVQESNMLVPEWELKWFAGNALLRPNHNEFDFTAADGMADFAKAHNLLFRGHALIWHESLPGWFQEFVNHQNAHQILINHIEKVVSHYAGRIHSWDVVNEAIAYDPRKSQRADSLRLTPWLKFLGPDYIDLAFRTAAAADPEALLVYNDFGMDYDTARDEAKRTAVLKLLKHSKSRGTPIHALGIQAHLQGDSADFNPHKLQRFLRDVAALDLKILITELDVVDKKLPPAIEVRDRIVASAYEDYLSVVLNEPAVIAVITWGLSDRYTYLSEFLPRSDGKPVRPLPLDINLKRKLAWNAMARAFNHAPKR
jgi:endo-1,4-beta-xylanase